MPGFRHRHSRVLFAFAAVKLTQYPQGRAVGPFSIAARAFMEVSGN